MKCPYCNSNLKNDAPGDGIWYNCESCGERFLRKENRLYPFPYKTTYFEDGIEYEDESEYGECQNCGASLKGCKYIGPYEEITNEEGFVRCKNCGFENTNI